MKDAQLELNKQKDLLKACNKDIGQKVNEQKQLQKDHHNSELKTQELEHKITKFQADTKGAARLVRFIQVDEIFLCLYVACRPMCRPYGCGYKIYRICLQIFPFYFSYTCTLV